MLSKQNLYDLAKCRFKEAEILLLNDMPDGAIYLCGYALELMLKRRITHILDWDGFPETNSEFAGKQSFKVHDLDTLLELSGLQKTITNDTELYARWQIARTWDSEVRYKQINRITKEEAGDIIEASRAILNYILRQT